MATHARALVKANGQEDVVEVIQSSVEDVDLPEKVDIIISEWMGYFLLRESMFDSVIVARDKFLKPGGSMFPSHARMFLAPVRTSSSSQRHGDMEASLGGWDQFVDVTRNNYGVDMSALTGEFKAERKDYYMNTTSWVDIHPSQLLGAPFILKVGLGRLCHPRHLSRVDYRALGV